MPDFIVDYIGKDPVNLSNPIQNEPTERDIEDMQRILVAVAKRPTLVPEGFWAQLIDQIQVGNLQIPVSQLLGYSQNQAQQATTVATAETTTSTSFTDLATTGPTLTGLPDGQYQVAFGATFDFSVGGAANAFMGVKANSTEAADNDSIFWNVPLGDFVPGTRVHTFTLTNGGNNTLTARYRVTGSTGRWRNRWLAAVRVANA